MRIIWQSLVQDALVCWNFWVAMVLLKGLVRFVPKAQGTKVCRYNWHSAGSFGWPFPMLKLKYKYTFQMKYTKAILSNSTRKLLWFESAKMPIAVKNKFTVSFIIILAHLCSLLMCFCSLNCCRSLPTILSFPFCLFHNWKHSVGYSGTRQQAACNKLGWLTWRVTRDNFQRGCWRPVHRSHTRCTATGLWSTSRCDDRCRCRRRSRLPRLCTIQHRRRRHSRFTNYRRRNAACLYT